ncbi:MAG: helix-turn-helix transcriptional regulator [Rhodospirillaceae bacterium]
MDKIFKAALGSRLRSLRQDAGVSVSDLAQAVNIDVSHYASAEAQGEGLTFGQLYDIAHSLGTTIDFVTEGLTE